MLTVVLLQTNFCFPILCFFSQIFCRFRIRINLELDLKKIYVLNRWETCGKEKIGKRKKDVSGIRFISPQNRNHKVEEGHSTGSELAHSSMKQLTLTIPFTIVSKRIKSK